MDFFTSGLPVVNEETKVSDGESKRILAVQQLKVFTMLLISKPFNYSWK